jgi:hypothetical protein
VGDFVMVQTNSERLRHSRTRLSTLLLVIIVTGSVPRQILSLNHMNSLLCAPNKVGENNLTIGVDHNYFQCFLGIASLIVPQDDLLATSCKDGQPLTRLNQYQVLLMV